MKSATLVTWGLVAIICIGFYAWTQDEKYPRDPWFFPLLVAIIFQVNTAK
jgi:hypothetical protein